MKFAFTSDQADCISLIEAVDEDQAYRIAIASLMLPFNNGVINHSGCSVREAAILFARHCQVLPVGDPVTDAPFDGDIPDVDPEDQIDEPGPDEPGTCAGCGARDMPRERELCGRCRI